MDSDPADDAQTTPTLANEIDALIDRLTTGEVDLSEAATTKHLVVDGVTATRIITAADRSHGMLMWAGTITRLHTHRSD